MARYKCLAFPEKGYGLSHRIFVSPGKNNSAPCIVQMVRERSML